MKCPVCGRPGRPFYASRGWTHLRCGTCGLLYVAPLPTPDFLKALYRDAGEPRDRKDAGSRLDRLEAEAQFRRAAPQGRFLDIGCGNGYFLSAGGNGIGVEWNPSVAARARVASGAPVVAADVTAGLPFRDGSFTWVAMRDVLEHLPDPTRALAEASRVLAPSGVLFLSLPNEEGLMARATRLMFGRIGFWRHPSPPWHVLEFGESSLRQALHLCGFRVLRVSRRHIPVRYLAAIPGVGIRHEVSATSWGLRAVYAVLVWPLRMAAELENAGDHLEVWARKGT